jgi:hypothetical protein
VVLSAGEERFLQFDVFMGTIRGVLVDVAQKPLAWRWIWARRSDAQPIASLGTVGIVHSRTDSTGQFEMRVPGETWIVGSDDSSTHPDDESFQGEEEVSRHVTQLVPWERAVIGPGKDEVDLRLEMQPALSISGRVLNSLGQPAQGIRVVAKFENLPQVVSTGKTDVMGRFVLDGLRPGRHVVSTLHGEVDAPSEPVLAQAGANEILLRLRRPGMLAVHVTDLFGKPHQAQVSIRGDLFGLGREEDEGTAEFTGLPAGTYRVYAHDARARVAAWTTVEVHPDQTTNAGLTLLPAAELVIRSEGSGDIEISSGGTIIERTHVSKRAVLIVPAGELEVAITDDRWHATQVWPVMLHPGEVKEMVVGVSR